MTAKQLRDAAELFLLDLDGTVYLGETPIGDMRRTLGRLREAGKKLVFLTNNSSKTEEEYRAKLCRIGLMDGRDAVYTSGMAAIEFLQTHHAGKRVYLLGTRALRAAFAAAGIWLDEDDPDVCMLAYDVELTFEKIEKFNRFLAEGRPYFATHPDDVCPTPYGSMPDAGSFMAMFERSSGRLPSQIIGKPYTAMGEAIERRFQVPRAHMCMVGDRMHTDIRFANNNGMLSVLVLSGETTRESMKKFPDRPTLVLQDLNKIWE